MPKILRLDYTPTTCEPDVILFRTDENAVYLNAESESNTPRFIKLTKRLTPGIIIMFGGNTLPGWTYGGRLPDGWLECKGQWLRIEDYRALYAVIGNKYDTENRAGHFQLPKFSGNSEVSGRVPVSDGGEAGGTYGGSEMTQLTINNIPSHRHYYHTLPNKMARCKVLISHWDMTIFSSGMYRNNPNGQPLHIAVQHAWPLSDRLTFAVRDYEHYKIVPYNYHSQHWAPDPRGTGTVHVQSSERGGGKKFTHMPEYTEVNFLIKT